MPTSALTQAIKEAQKQTDKKNNSQPQSSTESKDSTFQQSTRWQKSTFDSSEKLNSSKGFFVQPRNYPDFYFSPPESPKRLRMPKEEIFRTLKHLQKKRFLTSRRISESLRISSW